MAGKPALEERTICPDCGREVLANRDGSLRRHRDNQNRSCLTATGGVAHIALPWPTPPLAQNDRQHWTAKYRAFTQAKAEAQWAIRAARLRPMQQAEVTLHYRVPNRTRRDADGPAPTLKACLDALVHEGVLPDDSAAHVPAVIIRLHPPAKGLPGCLWLTLTPPA